MVFLVFLTGLACLFCLLFVTFLRPRTRYREALAEQKAAVFSMWATCVALLFTGRLCCCLQPWDLVLSGMETKCLELTV